MTTAIGHLFKLCQRTQQSSLTIRLASGSTFGLCPLFLLRDGGKWTNGGKWTETTATQHGGTVRLKFIYYITIKIIVVFFHPLFIFNFYLIYFLSFT
jgi:hypothetical protein